MAKVKWREAVFKDLIERAAALGWKEFDEEKLIGIILENAEKEPDANGFPSKLQKAYARAASFTDVGRKRFLNALKEEWPGKVKQKRKNKKPKPKDDVPTHIDPSCKACGGDGVNSKGGQCSPCQANGARVKKRGRPKKKKPEGGERNRNASRAPSPPKPPPPPPPPKGKKPPPPPPPRPKAKAPPPPPPPKAKRPPPPPPPPPKKAKPKEAQKPLGKPLAPPSAGKTYGPDAKDKPPRMKAPVFFAVAIQVRLDSSYEQTVVVEELNRYVVEQTGFGANVQGAKQLGPQIFDLRVHYAVHLTEVFDVVEGHKWVEKARVRPVQDLGEGEPIV